MKVFDKSPSVDITIATSKGAEQWTPQDVANVKEYRRKAKKEEFIEPLPLASITSPSSDIVTLKKSNAKYERVRKTLGRSPSVGISIVTPKGTVQWPQQDAINYKEYTRSRKKGELKVYSGFGKDATNAALP